VPLISYLRSFSCLNPSLCQFLYMGGFDWVWACDQLVNNSRVTDSGQNETYLYCCSRAVSGSILNKFAWRDPRLNCTANDRASLQEFWLTEVMV
jgi:hypothetical protein